MSNAAKLPAGSSNPSHTEQREDARPGFSHLALAAIAATLNSEAGGPGAVGQEEHLLRQVLEDVRGYAPSLQEALDRAIRSPTPHDGPLLDLARELTLTAPEILAVALAAEVERDLVTGRLLAHVQAPIGGSRPSLGLLSHAFASAFGAGGAILPDLVSGAAFRTGLLVTTDESAPVPERSVRVPLPTCLAMSGRDGQWPNTTIGLDDQAWVPLPASTLAEAARHAAALRTHRRSALLIRSTSQIEGRTVAAAIAKGLQRRPVFVGTDGLEGIGPWLILRRMIPIFCLEMSPGDVRRLPDIAGYRGPVVILCGPDGSIETSTGGAATWVLRVPGRAERRALWQTAVSDQVLAHEVGAQFRHGAGRIAHLGRVARHYAALSGRTKPTRDDILEAAWTGEGGGLDALADPLRDRVSDDALVTTSQLSRDLEALLLRCRLRDDLMDGLGVSVTTRYRPGLRALFTGPSGTGKTLAAGWIATRLSLPLYRVDLASVTSKYIGETEKNLSQLLSRAEEAEVILLFDEADSLFGKRTDVSDSNDRFANAQTNYLLQRIESYDGIVLLTSNSQSRFDPAFTRRLDFTIEFPQPGPEERRAIWLAHLGTSNGLTYGELNQLAVRIDLGGGHIRNAVLAAAAFARDRQRRITFEDVIEGVASEYQKLGRQLPTDLKSR